MVVWFSEKKHKKTTNGYDMYCFSFFGKTQLEQK